MEYVLTLVVNHLQMDTSCYQAQVLALLMYLALI